MQYYTKSRKSSDNRKPKSRKSFKSGLVILALNDQAIAVMLDLVQPVGTGRDLGAARREARLELGLTHAGKIDRAGRKSSFATAIATGQARASK